MSLAKRMRTTSDSHNVLCVDMSLRATGFAVIHLSYNENKLLKRLEDFGCYCTEPKGLNRFHALECDAEQLSQVMESLSRKEIEYNTSAIIVEFPSITQSAHAAVCIGMLWGAWSQSFSKPNFVSIEETALKEWSGSKRGDKKTKVKQSVTDRLWLPEKAANNDNIVDAVAIALMFSDLYHATHTNTK